MTISFPEGTANSFTSPYHPAFRAIEENAANGPLSPQGAYEIYEEYLADGDLDPLVYLSMAITSGGFARDPKLGVGEVIARNSLFGTLAKEALLRQHPELQEHDVVLPSDLGKVQDWSQADYLLFWFHVIVGWNVDRARDMSERMAPSLRYPAFTDKRVSAEEKGFGYRQFTFDYVQGMHQLAKQHGRIRPNNMQAMLTILDGDTSLGGKAEALLCRSIGIPPQCTFLDRQTVREFEAFDASVRTLQAMGASALGDSINPPHIRFAGVSAGPTSADLAAALGFRKTGLFNTLLAIEYYEQHPGTRPARHQGHTPTASHRPRTEERPARTVQRLESL